MTQTATPSMISTRGVSWSPAKMLANGFDWFITIGDRTARGQAVNALSAMSDEELAAQGTTRLAEARKIFGAHWHL